FMPAGLCAKLASQKIETVFVVGPNHWEKGEKILTSNAIWETPFGNVMPNEEIISDLKEKGLMQIENYIMQKEHSTTGLFPLIAYYLPNVKIVPIILSAKNTRAEIEKLNDELSKYLENEKNMLVVSVDFSHYLNSNEAESKDNETLKVLQSFDYDKLFQLNNDNLDSPTSIATFLSATQKNGKAKFEVIDHSNSANILGGNIVKTTSYFSLAACR
ncbi:MAG: AmmeMemoRadiSam system protein B, partial [Candidatus Moraniibacteriota bacterium]